MKIWLIQTGEPTPLPGRKTRLYRTGMLADILHSAGHKVVWWSATFDHADRAQRFNSFTRTLSDSGYELLLLPGCVYEHNICVRRLVNHAQLALSFDRHCRHVPLPDVILCAMPTIELCYRVGVYARRLGIPFIVDIRDLWPDIFLIGRHRVFCMAASFPIFLLNQMLLRALRTAAGLIAVSDSYLKWGLSKIGRSRTSSDRVFKLGYDDTPLQKEPDEEMKRWVNSLGLLKDGINCWFVGTFGTTYNVSTIIDAARILIHKRDIRVRFILSGKGGDEAALRKQSSGLKNVLFTGWLDKRKLLALMPHMKIGLAAYTEDAPQSIPNKIGEYASAGLAIVSSLKGETADLLEKHNCGITYHAYDPAALVSAIHLLADDPALLATMRKNARRIYSAEFDSKVIYRQMVNYLEKMAGQTELPLPDELI